VFVGMVLMLIFGEVLGLYGCVIGPLVCGQLLTVVPVPLQPYCRLDYEHKSDYGRCLRLATTRTMF
jgi:hypothetical protein